MKIFFISFSLVKFNLNLNVLSAISINLHARETDEA